MWGDPGEGAGVRVVLFPLTLLQIKAIPFLAPLIQVQ